MKPRKHLSNKQHVKAALASFFIGAFYSANSQGFATLAAALLGMTTLWILYFVHDVVSNQDISQDK